MSYYTHTASPEVTGPVRVGLDGKAHLTPAQCDELFQKRKPYQPKTGAKCSCRRGIERDNCPQCEGTGWRIDFRAIRERHGRNAI